MSSLLLLALLTVLPLRRVVSSTSDFPRTTAEAEGDLKTLRFGRTGEEGEDKQGDILLTNTQKEALLSKESEGGSTNTHRAKRSSFMSSRNIIYTWPNGVVPYRISALLGRKHRVMFMDAIRSIEYGTCIKFIRRTNQQNYIEFEEATSCKSFVGNLGGRQIVTFGSSCESVGNVIHELGHALGLWHEHSRPDRDNYIQVLYDNLGRPEYEVNFRKIPMELFRSVPDVGYDLESIMHYGRFAFGKVNSGYDLRTIKVKQNSSLEELKCENLLPLGQRRQLSYKDKKRINALYQCQGFIEEPICRTSEVATTTGTERETMPTTMVSPTTVVRPLTGVTPPPLDKRLRSRNYITIKLGFERTDSNQGVYGMQCPNYGCVPVQCMGSLCESLQNQFQIIKVNGTTDGSIRSGDIIVLRSIDSYSQFVECPSTCRIGQCLQDEDVDDRTSPNYISSCESHKFEIFGVGRKQGKILSTRMRIQFRKLNANPLLTVGYYLSCNGRRCEVRMEGSCPRRSTIFNLNKENSANCPIDYFVVTKLRES